jgi:hypothetical protein
VFQRLENAGLKVNTTESFFGKSELEYLGIWITHEDIKPLPKKYKQFYSLQSLRQRKNFANLWA